MRDVRFADRVMTFDGEVLEVFGGTALDSTRCHVALAVVDWNDADPATGRPALVGLRSTPASAVLHVEVADDDVAAVHAFVNSVQLAIASHQGRVNPPAH